MPEQNLGETEEAEEAAIIKLSMQTLKMHYGLNPGKYRKPVKSIGYQLGAELAKILPQQGSKDVQQVVKDLSSFWMRHEIGEMGWVSNGEGLVRIQFCSDCLGRSYGIGFTLCPFKEGLLEAVLKSRLDTNFHVEEIECCGTQAEGCLFKIESNP